MMLLPAAAELSMHTSLLTKSLPSSHFIGRPNLFPISGSICPTWVLPQVSAVPGAALAP